MTILTQILVVGVVGVLFFLLLMLVRSSVRQFRSSYHGGADGSSAVYTYSSFSGGDGGGDGCGDGGSGGGDGGGGCGGGGD